METTIAEFLGKEGVLGILGLLIGGSWTVVAWLVKERSTLTKETNKVRAKLEALQEERSEENKVSVERMRDQTEAFKDLNRTLMLLGRGGTGFMGPTHGDQER